MGSTKKRSKRVGARKRMKIDGDNDLEMIDLDKIEQNENSRVVYKQSDISELMQSMKKNGLLQCVGVKAFGNGKYEAVWGNRRILAAKKLGWKDILAKVVVVETDTDRDIIGLVENMKRQNTSPFEDGRMFQSLIDRGLSQDELAARLDVDRVRIGTCLDVFNHLPKEYQKQVKYVGSGPNRAGVIPASTAAHILAIRRKHGLSKEATARLLDHAKSSPTAARDLKRAAPMIKEGHSVAAALKAVSKYVCIHLDVYIEETNIKRLEKKYGGTITDLLWSHLERQQEFKAVRTPGAKTTNASKVIRIGATADDRKTKTLAVAAKA